MYLRLPKAWSSENRDVAALLTLPFTRKPSDDCWLASSAGFGISAAFSPGAPGRRGLLNRAGAVQRGQRSGRKLRQLRDLVERQQRQLPLRRGRVRGDSDFVVDGREALHVDFDLCHTPSARSAKVYRPPWSVTVVSFFVPCVTVTVAPGAGKPPKVTWPWYAEAAARLGKGQRRKSANQVEDSLRSPPCHRCQHVPMSVRR